MALLTLENKREERKKKRKRKKKLEIALHISIEENSDGTVRVRKTEISYPRSIMYVEPCLVSVTRSIWWAKGRKKHENNRNT